MAEEEATAIAQAITEGELDPDLQVPPERQSAFDFNHVSQMFCGAFDPFVTLKEEPPPPAGFWHEETLRNGAMKGGEDLLKFTTAGDSVKTLFQTFEYGVQRNPQAPCLGKRTSPTSPYSWKTYSQIQSEAENIGSFLKSVGVTPGQRVGLSGKNAPEYLTAIQGCFWAGATTVSRHLAF